VLVQNDVLVLDGLVRVEERRVASPHVP
jgi:hypothetical protein